MTPNKAIDEIREIAETVFRANAEAADRELVGLAHPPPGRESPTNGGALAGNIRLLAERGYFGLGIDTRYGGIGADDFTRREFTEIIAAACGVTAFTQHQFHAGGSFAGNSRSESLKDHLLPRLASGNVICGVAFSHLRRPGAPAVTARRVDGGFIVDGHAPWVTGWSFLDGIILGATVVSDSEGDEHLFAYVPKEGNEQSMTAGPPIELHVMNASDTVEIDLKDLFIPQSNVTGARPAEELRRSDYCGITGHVFLPLGCARGSVRYLRDLAASRGNDRLAEIAGVLDREIDACRREAITWNGSCADMPDYKRHALGARTGAIELAVRAAHAAVAATGGTAQMLDRAPQRLMREAVFYTTLAQTPDVQAGTLDRLASM